MSNKSTWPKKQRVPEKTLATIRDLFRQKYRYAEIAEITGLPVGTVATKVYQARMAGELWAPRRRNDGPPRPRICAVHGCTARIRDYNKSGVCRTHIHEPGACLCQTCRREVAA